MANLPSLNVKIVEHCNYKCRSCNTYSSIASKKEYCLIEYERDIKRVSQLFSKINSFKILGGEPLLTKNINEYIKIARNNLPNSNISIITNGYLLHKMSDEFFETVKNNYVSLNISYYYTNTTHLVDKGIEKLKEKNIEHKVVPIKYFAVWYRDNASKSEPQKTYNYCKVRVDSTNLYQGRVYGCSAPFSLEYYDKKYKTKRMKISDGIDIHEDNMTGEKILQHLSRYMETCKDCTLIHSFTKWEEGEPEQSDWENTNKNTKVLNDFTWRDYLVEMEKLEYKALKFDSINKILLNVVLDEEELLKNNNKIYAWIEDESATCLYEELFQSTLIRKNISIVQLINAYQEEINFIKLNTDGVIILLASNYKNYLSSIRKIQKVTGFKLVN